MHKITKDAVAFVLAGACTITMSLVNGNPDICKVAEASEKVSGGELLKKISMKSEEQEAALQRKIEKNRKKQEKACLAYEDLTKSFQKKTKKSTEEYPDYYGGAYINDNDILTINVTTDSTDIKEELQEVTQDQEVGFKKVKYEYNQLLDLYNMLGNKITDSQIANQVTGFYVDEVSNRVIVKIKDLSDVNKFKKQISDSSMITYEKGEEIKTTAMTKFKPGAELDVVGAGYYSSSYRCRKITSDGNYTIGVITAAHDNKLKQKVKTASGKNFGVVFARKYSGNVDASYVRCLSSRYDLSNVIKYSGSSLAAGKYFKTVPVGTTVYKVGYKTQLTSGKVLSNSCTYYVANCPTISDSVLANYKSDFGDSGGLVYADSNGKYQIVGNHTANSANDKVGYEAYSIKATNVIKALGVTPY